MEHALWILMFPTNLTNFLSSFGIVYVSILKAHLLEANF